MRIPMKTKMTTEKNGTRIPLKTKMAADFFLNLFYPSFPRHPRSVFLSVIRPFRIIRVLFYVSNPSFLCHLRSVFLPIRLIEFALISLFKKSRQILKIFLPLDT